MIDRIITAIRALVRRELAPVRFFGVYEYTVQRAAPGAVDAAPASSLGLPAHTNVPVLPSLLGQTVTPAAVGQTCRIRFLNGNPARPVCVGLGAPGVDATVDASGTLQVGPNAASVVLAGGSQDVAREGDAVTIVLPPGVLVGVVTPPGGSPVTVGPLTITSAISGIIGSGSARSTA